MNYKKIILMSTIIATMISPLNVFAQTNTNAFTKPQAKSVNLVQQNSPKLQRITAIGLDSYVNKINQCVTVTDINIIFDAKKASEVGISKNQVIKLKKIYTEMNNSVENNSLKIVKTSSGKFDIAPIANISNQITPNAIATSEWYGIDIYFSPSDCSDIAAILAGGVGVAAVVGGICALPGITAPLAIPISAIAGGVIGIGSAVFWLASNHHGLNQTILWNTASTYSIDW